MTTAERDTILNVLYSIGRVLYDYTLTGIVINMYVNGNDDEIVFSIKNEKIGRCGDLYAEEHEVRLKLDFVIGLFEVDDALYTEITAEINRQVEAARKAVEERKKKATEEAAKRNLERERAEYLRLKTMFEGKENDA